MILHTLNGSPSSQAFQDCLRFVSAGDALLLMGDGVYTALPGTRSYGDLLATTVELYALAADVSSAGIGQLLCEEVSVINFDEFAALTERFPRQQAWY